MQQTRRLILDILRERGDATVEEIVADLKERIQHDITAVTVRHHLDILRGDDLVTAPAVRRSGAPGRPQYVYALTEKARDAFPNNYQNLMNYFLEQLKAKLPQNQVNVILEGVADLMIADAHIPESVLHTIPMEVRLDHVIGYLNQHGYEAAWEAHPEGYLVRTRNCPYYRLSPDHAELCGMDMRLIAGLVGVVPRSLGHIADGDESCSYLIPIAQAARS